MNCGCSSSWSVTEHAGWLSINRVMLLTSCCLWETVSRCLPIKNKNYCWSVVVSGQPRCCIWDPSWKSRLHTYVPLGARSKEDVLQLEQFEQFGTVYVTTEDGSLGEKGYVTNHSILKDVHFDRIYTCGPKPMMVAVAKYAHANSIICEVSLENTMACGIGACLCCVEKTKDEHHVCVCTEGPVFNIENLTWLN